MSPISHPTLLETLNYRSPSVSLQAFNTHTHTHTHDRWQFLSACSQTDDEQTNERMTGGERICTVPLYLPNAALLRTKTSTMRTGVRIMEDRVSPGSLTASLPKQQRNFGRINFEDKSQDGGANGEAGLAGGGLQGTRVTLSVMRRAIWGAKCSLPEVLQPRQNPERKLSLHLALIRSNFPSWIQEDPPKINPYVRGFLQLQCG